MPSAREPSDPAIPLKEPAPTAYAADVEVLTTQLMNATKAGDRRAFDQLVQTLRSRAFAVARSFVGSREDALEMCQEAFLKTYRARTTFRDGDPFLPWFHRILRNTCFSFLRKNGRLRRHSISGDAEEGESDWQIEADVPAPEAGLERDEAVLALRAAFERLSTRDREILSLRHFEELSYRDIARTLGIPEGTVMSRLFHARRRLRDHLQPHLSNALKDYAPATGTDEVPS